MVRDPHRDGVQCGQLLYPAGSLHPSQVELTVEVQRVGHFSSSSHALSTPRSLSIIPEVAREDSHMTRMSSVMLSEWLRFVATEKQVSTATAHAVITCGCTGAREGMMLGYGDSVGDACLNSGRIRRDSVSELTVCTQRLRL